MAERARLRSPLDAVSALTTFAVLLIVLPSRYVFAPLGSAGIPALVLALGIALWWVTDWVGQASPRSRIRQPVRIPAVMFLTATLLGYLMAAVRPTSAQEQLGTDRALLSLLAWMGLLFTAMDGIPSYERLQVLLRRLTILGAFLAAVGIAQFFTGQTFVEYLHLPGLSELSVDEGVLNRGGFVRPAGTAVHPIEFGVTLAMLLPVGLHLAIEDAGRRGPVARWLPVGIIALALPISISRSAVVSTGVALAVMLPTWERHLRRLVYLGIVALLSALMVALPGFLGAVVGLFTGISSDDSALSRTDSYAFAWSLVSRAPLFGRGPGTFLPRYRILDNQYLVSLIETGFMGAVWLVLLFAVGAVTAFRTRRMVQQSVEPSRSAAHRAAALGPAVAAGILGGSVSFAFFDAFSFPMTPGVIFLLVGVSGALFRLAREGDQPPPGVDEGTTEGAT